MYLGTVLLQDLQDVVVCSLRCHVQGCHEARERERKRDRERTRREEEREGENKERGGARGRERDG